MKRHSRWLAVAALSCGGRVGASGGSGGVRVTLEVDCLTSDSDATVVDSAGACRDVPPRPAASGGTGSGGGAARDASSPVDASHDGSGPHAGGTGGAAAHDSSLPADASHDSGPDPG